MAASSSESEGSEEDRLFEARTEDSSRYIAASVWLASVSISASSARTASASASSSRSRAPRCMRAALDSRRLCSNRESKLSLGLCIPQILSVFRGFHNKIITIRKLGLAVPFENVAGNGPQRIGIFRIRKVL